MNYFADTLEKKICMVSRFETFAGHETAPEIAGNFLYGKAYYMPIGRNQPQFNLTPEAAKILEQLPGNDWEHLDAGNHPLIFANDDVVLKLKYRDEKQNLPADVIPEGLAAKTIAKGTCNGVEYMICERLQQKEIVAEDIIPFLFKAHELKLGYPDIRRLSFGYNSKGEIRAVDANRFILADSAGKSLKNALQKVVALANLDDYPLYNRDDKSTYIVFDPHADDQQRKMMHTKLLDRLSIVGIGGEDVLTIPGTTVTRIMRTEVTYGTPPETEALEDYLTRSLAVNNRSVTRGRSFIREVKTLLEPMGDQAGKYADMLPNPLLLSLMKESDFKRLADTIKANLNNPELDALFEGYQKATYHSPSPKQ